MTKLERIAEDIVELPVKSAAEAQRMARALRAAGLGQEVVPGLEQVAMMFDPAVQTFDALCLSVEAVLGAVDTEEDQTGEIIEIGAHYGGADGLDFDEICKTLDLTPQALIAAHTEPVYTVDMIGFTPGFAYLSGLSEKLSLPRRDQPRPRLKAGSIGVAGAYCGLYALAGPGGWPIIGRTEHTLFEAAADDPFLIQPGQQIRFKAL